MNQLFSRERCYRPDEIATILAVDRVTVYRMIKNIEHPLPAFRVGGKGPLRVAGLDLIHYLDEHRVRPEDE